MYLLDWTTAQTAGVELAGGKGWNLGRLARYGFSVPPGGVLSSEAYRLFMQQPALQAGAEALAQLTGAEAATPAGAARLAQFRAEMLALPLPAAVMAELAAAPWGAPVRSPVAVRSSAVAEDSAGASFAGIHASFLNVTGPAAVAEAVKGCYASLWTPQAVAYRRKLGLSDAAVAAAVVILAMVPAKAAGVGFSCDPRTGRRDRHAISATLGLGEALVSGAVQPDEYLVDISDYPPRVVERHIGQKRAITVPAPDGGTRLSPLDPAAAARPALTDDQLTDLAHLLARIQDALGDMEQPQDVEWAHDGERFWILQSRPVTKLPPATFPAVADQPVYWSNANLRDALPGVQSAQGWSSFRASMDRLASAPLLAAGWPYAGGMTWVRLFEGRAYINLTALEWAMYDALGITPAETNRILGGHQPEIPVPPATPAQRLRRGLGQLRMTRVMLTSMNQAEQRFKAISDWAAERLAQDCSGWSNQQFQDRMQEVKRVIDPFLPFFQILNGAAGGLHQELIKSLTPAFGDRATALANAMLAGSGNVTSAEQGVRLVALGNLALREATAAAYFTAGDWDPAAWAERLAGTRFRAQFEAFLKEYGHRGVYEVEPMNPRWNEDPTYLLATVRSQVVSGQEIRLPDQAGKREAATREVMRRLRFSPRALMVRQYVKLAGRAAGQREMAKSMVVKAAGVSRHYCLALGNRLAAEGLIPERDDIFHLTFLDLWAYLQGEPVGAGFAALVADRKALRAVHLRLEPPDVIVGEVPEKKVPAPTGPALTGVVVTEAARTGPVLTGMGVAAGRAAGRARVILHPDQGPELLPGEILVAPSTDPAWTPLFLRAAGVVMEVGGHLSHGAIVAREYGLPAVVNVPGLLQAVQTGDWLTVDGDAGKVYRGA
ncbi:MAG TPA: PEP/pyruvate-binding domain-containing protein [Symbiobacteriaceae bacterium]|jgi:pyruvate,water dikinase